MSDEAKRAHQLQANRLFWKRASTSAAVYRARVRELAKLPESNQNPFSAHPRAEKSSSDKT